MDQTTAYIQFAELLINLGLATIEQIHTALSTTVSPADLEVILGEVHTRLARRGLADATGHP